MTKTVALVGTGPAGFGFIKGLVEKLEEGRLSAEDISTIHIFEKSQILGAGLPYDPLTTDIEHLLNVPTVSAAMPNSGHDFFKWMQENENSIKTTVEDIFVKRFLVKFKERFGEDYDERREYRGKQEELINQYEAIFNSIEKRYLDFKVGKKYHPRILFGLYQAAIFEENLKKLEAAGLVIERHVGTEVVNLEKISEQDLRIEFIANNSDEKHELSVSDAVLAVGRWSKKSERKSDRYLSQIWPVQKLREQLDRITSEIKADPTHPRVVDIAIEGTSLSAIDILKTIYRDSYFKFDEEGKMIFILHVEDEIVFRVDMVSRGGMMQTVKPEKSLWDEFRDPTTKRATFPEGIHFTSETFASIIEDQGEKMRLWQPMLMLMRSIELGYRLEVSENLEKAAEIRGFLLDVLIKNIGKEDDAKAHSIDEINEFLDQLKGGAKDQLFAMQKFFGLKLDGANYTEILQAVKGALLPPEGSLARLEENLKEAKFGDANGFLVWQSMYYLMSAAFSSSKLIPQETALYECFFDRFQHILENGMPIQTAEELLAMHRSGFFNVVALGSKTTKIRGEDEVGDEKAYDVVINTHGITFDLDHAPPLFKSLARQGLVSNYDAELPAGSQEDLRSRFGDELAGPMIRTLREGEDGKLICRRPYLKTPEDGNIYISTAGSAADAVRSGSSIAAKLTTPQTVFAVGAGASVGSSGMAMV